MTLLKEKRYWYSGRLINSSHCPDRMLAFGGSVCYYNSVVRNKKICFESLGLGEVPYRRL